MESNGIQLLLGTAVLQCSAAFCCGCSTQHCRVHDTALHSAECRHCTLHCTVHSAGTALHCTVHRQSTVQTAWHCTAHCTSTALLQQSFAAEDQCSTYRSCAAILSDQSDQRLIKSLQMLKLHSKSEQLKLALQIGQFISQELATSLEPLTQWPITQ